MEARKLAVQVAALCPFALVMGVGYSARTPQSRTALFYTDAQNARLAVYQPLMISRPDMGKVRPVESLDTIRSYADSWIKLDSRVRLQALTPAFQEEIAEDNARSQVLSTWMQSLNLLEGGVQREATLGKTDLAVNDFVRMTRFGSILRCSDFTSYDLSTSKAANAVAAIVPLMPRMSGHQRKEVIDAAQVLRGDHGKLAKLYDVMRGVTENYLVRTEPEMRMTDVSETNETTDRVVRNLQAAYFASVKREASLESKIDLLDGHKTTFRAGS